MGNAQDLVGSTLARRYTIERELSRGGMSTVYVARDSRHDREVAIKIFPPALAAAIGVDRFKREIAITSRLAHPHILPLYDSGETGGVLYYVMPLVKGESLRDRLEQHPDGVALDEVMSIARQIAQAIDHAHSLGIIHRDVTPGNILIAEGHAVLADFGVARLVDAETMTESGLPFGTAMYRSPEQASGHAHLGPETDVYSLACVLYECIGGSAAAKSLQNRFAARVPALRLGSATLSHTIDTSLARAMSLDPKDRFGSAGELVRALDRPRRFHLPFRRILQTAAVLAILAAGAVGFTIMRNRASNVVRNRVLVERFDNRTGDKSFDALSEMTSDYISRGLAETGLLEVIDSRLLADGVAESSVGAATVIHGTLYKRGDQIHIETRVTDARSGKLLVATKPVEGSSTVVAEQLRQQLMGNFAAMFGAQFEQWQAASLPPSYEAYQEILAGDDAIGANDYPASVDHYLRAAALDTTYTGARALAIVGAAVEGDCVTVDSISTALSSRKSTLAAVDQGRIDWGTAECRHDLNASLVAGRRVMSYAPRSIAFTILTAIPAVELYRPREAIRILSSVSPANTPFSAAQRMFHTSFLGLAWHEIGDFDREARVFREGLISMPDDPHLRVGHMMALSASGKIDEATRELDQFIGGNARYDRPLWSPAQIDVCVAAEMRAHGYRDASERIFQRGAIWFRTRVALDGTIPTDVVCTHRLFIAPYYAGDYKFTRTFYSRVLESDSLNLEAHEALGALAAHEHLLDEVHKMDLWLAQHASGDGRNTYSRARIAAIAGEGNRAVKLLIQARREGIKSATLHVDPDLESIRAMPEYKDLVRLTG